MGIVDFLEKFTHNGALITLLVSMLPIVELRGAIPIGVMLGLSVKQALLISVVGNMLPVPFILLFVRKVFDWLKRRSPRLRGFVERLEAKAKKKQDVVRKWEFFGLALIVAIPLPGTGAWTGALVAAIMDMRLKRAIPSILLGVLVAGVLISLLTYGLSAFVT